MRENEMMIFEIMIMMSKRWREMIWMVLDDLDMMQMSGQKNGEDDFDERNDSMNALQNA